MFSFEGNDWSVLQVIMSFFLSSWHTNTILFKVYKGLGMFLDYPLDAMYLFMALCTNLTLPRLCGSNKCFPKSLVNMNHLLYYIHAALGSNLWGVFSFENVSSSWLLSVKLGLVCARVITRLHYTCVPRFCMSSCVAWSQKRRPWWWPAVYFLCCYVVLLWNAALCN